MLGVVMVAVVEAVDSDAPGIRAWTIVRPN
jgi:hypothetical protein